jgi:transposase
LCSIVYLGKDGVSKMNHKVRLIEVEDTGGNPLIIVTNDFNLSAEEIGDIYRYRWKIELFFKWLKQHFQVKHFYGLSKQAVENQLFISLIAYCLLMLLKLKTNFKGTLLTIKRLLNTCLLEPFNIFLKKLNWKLLYNKRTSVERCFGRLKEHLGLETGLNVRGIKKVKTHAYLSVITMIASVIAINKDKSSTDIAA